MTRGVMISNNETGVLKAEIIWGISPFSGAEGQIFFNNPELKLFHRNFYFYLRFLLFKIYNHLLHLLIRWNHFMQIN